MTVGLASADIPEQIGESETRPRDTHVTTNARRRGRARVLAVKLLCRPNQDRVNIVMSCVYVFCQS